MARYSSIVFLWFFASLSLYSQTEQYHIEHLTPQDGLSFGPVAPITQDSKGFIWIPTWLGLNRYDGYTIREYTADPRDPHSISSNVAAFVYEDPADSGKFLWIGTYGGGLNKFDWETEQFTRFQYDPHDTTSLSGNDVHCIYKSSPGYYLLGTTANGLNLFDRANGTFQRYQHDPHNPGSLSHDRIRYISGDHWGNTWIATDKGLNRLPPVYDAAGNVVADRWNKKHINFMHYYHNEKDSTSLPSDQVFCVYEDRQGVLWIGAYTGLRIYDRETDSFHRHRFVDGYSYDLDHGYIYFITEDAAGNLWVAMHLDGQRQAANAGLIRINPTRDGFIRFRHDPQNPNSLSGTAHLNLIQDSSGIIWTCDWRIGVDKLVPTHRQFRRFTHIPGDSNSLSSKNVSLFCEDSTGSLWIGTHGGGLNRFDRKQNRFKAYRYPDIDQTIWNINTSRAGEIWTSRGSCMTKFDPKTEKMTIYNLEDFLGNYDSYGVDFVFEDRAGVLWCLINLIQKGNQVYQFDEARRRFDKYQAASHPEAIAHVSRIYEDRGGTLWFTTLGHGLLKRIATGGGHPPGSNDQFIQYKHLPGDPKSLSSNRTHSIVEDSRGFYWISTDEGLNKLDPQTGAFTHYLKADGLPSDRISYMAEDDRGNLWMCTFRGLSRFNLKTEIFQNFDESDGLPKMGFSAYWEMGFNGYWGLYKTANGEMSCADPEGFFVFHPDSLTDNTHVPPIVLTDFRLFNQSVRPGKDSPLQQSIAVAREIRLAHDQDVFSFEFAALDFTCPEKNRYAHKMEGVDRDWVYTDASRRFATYTNLDPGEYTFRVKGCNNDGVWNEEGTSIKIIITPPWWKTGWAYTAYILFTAAILLGLWRFQMSRLRLKHQAEMEHFHAEKLEEVDRLKSRFFANISHEFRTPMTLILGPLQNLIDSTENKRLRDIYLLMQRSGNRLLRLINQLLDLSKLEAGKMTLQAAPCDLDRTLRPIVMAFESLAVLRQIDLRYEGPVVPVMIYLDRDKFEKIVTNLLSNAFKFTQDGGRVTVAVAVDSGGGSGSSSEKQSCSDFVEITVKDSGIGIPPDRMPHIFDRFYQADSSRTREPAPLDKSGTKHHPSPHRVYPTGQEGSGIGLALVKELVELHRGTIAVESREGKGTTFIVRLPLGTDSFTEDEIVDAPAQLSESFNEVEAVQGIEQSGSPADADYAPKPSQDSGTDIILIVEDNADMRTYLRESLEYKYNVLEAEDGEKGFKIGARKIPDLIISDVMMPKMDGFELCTKLKNDERTSHIPVILLTARAAGEDKIGGLRTGADDYLTKPFDVKELQVRVENLIEQRRKLRRRFCREVILKPQEVAITPMDEVFLHKVQVAVEAHIDDEDFTVEILAQEAGMSRVQLHRKLRALVDQSASQFIRSMRLRRALELLKQSAGNIAEIAYMSGFPSQAYFDTCFREQFGCTPTQFLKDNRCNSD